MNDECIMRTGTAGLLVSVRSAEEAAAALAGGARLIDVKEPDRGALGRADDRVIGDVIRMVAGRHPVSAALGELRDFATNSLGCSSMAEHLAGLTFAKWGLAGMEPSPDWQQQLARATTSLKHILPACRVVPVAYADWQRALAPPPGAVVAYARANHCAALLLDTYCKDGRTLLDWMNKEEIIHLGRACRHAGIALALAGSLRGPELCRLRMVQPTWFAVRGAVCHEGDRRQAIDVQRVRDLVDYLEPTDLVPATFGS